jgi:tetratricopeptide (TPR) repeat protein
MSRRFIVPILVLALSGILAGCSSPQRQFARAAKLQASGHTAKALGLYRQVLQKTPPADFKLRSQTYLHIGECLWRQEQPADAFEAFQRAAETDPSNAVAHLRLGEIFLAAGALESAAEQAQHVLDSVEGNVEALALLGAASAGVGNKELAESAFKRVLEAEPARINIAVALADLYNGQERIEEARKVLQAAAGVQPGSSVPLLALGRLEEQEGNLQPAEEAYRRAVAAEDSPETNLRLAQFLERASRISEAEEVLRRVDTMRPGLPTALPDFNFIANRADAALDSYLASILDVPDEKPSGRLRLFEGKRLSDGISNRALLAARIVEADLHSAHVAETSAGNKNPAAARARAHLEQYRAEFDPATVAILEAEIALAEDDLPAAALRAGEAVAGAPQSPAAHYVLGVTKYRAGDAVAASAEWQAALQADSSFVPARLALTEISLKTRDLTAAEDYIVQAVREEPANFRGLLLFARVLAAQGRLTSAALVARRAQAVDGKAAEPHLILGEIALKQRNAAKALMEFEQAMQLQPHSQAAIEGLTRVYRAGAIKKPMLRKMERIAESEPRSATLMEITGRLYAERGWYRDAQRSLARALEIDPQRATAAKALAQTLAATGQLAAAADSAARVGGNSAALLAGFRAEQRQDVAAAIQSYEAAVRQGEPSGVAANNLAWLLARQGTTLDKALSFAEMARSMDPQNPAVLDTLGVVHLARREYSAAIEALKSAALLAGKKSGDTAHQQLLGEIRRHLAEAYLRSGQPDAAALVARNADIALLERRE